MTTLPLPAGLLLLTVTASCFLPAARAQCLPDQPASGGMTVEYRGTQVTYNEDVELSRVGDAPSLTADDVQGDLLLVMVDPDAPSARQCPAKYWLHWMAEARVQNGQVVITTTLVEYNPPTPPQGSGPHRYQFALYPLNESVPAADVPTHRGGFDLAAFASDLGLGNPVASFQFTAEN